MRTHATKILLLAGIALSFIVSLFQSQINPYFLQIIIYIGINIILAASLNLINGFAGQFSLGHAGFMALGGYTGALVSTALGATAGGNWAAVILPLALILGGIVAALAGLLVGIPSLRLRGDYLAITTLGFGEIIRAVIQNLDFLGGARGFTGIPKLTNFFWVFSVVSITIFVISNLVNSSYGKGFLAVRTKYKVIAFVTGAFFAGVAGGLYAHFVSYINPQQFSFIRSIEIVVMVIVGGMGNTPGVIIAAALLTILPEALRPIAEYRMVIYSLSLVIIMITRPQGLFGRGVSLRSLLSRMRKQAMPV
jgi:branched-chain amino acid transport system permease protein